MLGSYFVVAFPVLIVLHWSQLVELDSTEELLLMFSSTVYGNFCLFISIFWTISHVFFSSAMRHTRRVMCSASVSTRVSRHTRRIMCSTSCPYVSQAEWRLQPAGGGCSIVCYHVCRLFLREGIPALLVLREQLWGTGFQREGCVPVRLGSHQFGCFGGHFSRTCLHGACSRLLNMPNADFANFVPV